MTMLNLFKIYRLLTFSSFVATSFLGCEENSLKNSDEDGNIVVQTCDAKDDLCLSQDEVVHCVDGVRIREYCASGEYCFEGQCNPVVCEAGAIESCREDGRYHGCNAVGTGMGDYACGEGLTCVDHQCVARLCLEGAGKCLDEETILLCNEAGTAYDVSTKCADISAKTVCEDGACIPICDQTSKNASYIGCEYWAVDLDNAIDGGGSLDAAGQPFAVVLSNTHATLNANVQIYSRKGNTVTKLLDFEIPAGDLRTAFLPVSCYDNVTSCDAAYLVNGTTIQEAAFYIKSDLPITAAQFNPLENVDVFSNDASLLFPTTAHGKRYMVMSRKQFYDTFHAFMTVVATQPGQTEVAVRTTCPIQDGKDKNGGTIYAMKKGDTQVFYLDQYDVLNLETKSIGDDLTGSVITADKNIAVFAGNEATSIPETDPITCCADHIEHQQYPLSAWGKTYNAVKTKPRGKEREMWRILARLDDTRVTLTPDVVSENPLVLNAGQWIDILTTESFSIEANQPILVGQFLTGQNDPIDPETGVQTPDWAGIGDPSYIIGVPIEQYRMSYRFLVPSKYEEDYITVVAPIDATVALDGLDIDASQFNAFGDGQYKAAYVRVQDGSHGIEASAPIGLFSYGFDNYVSYGYTAGLDLKDLFADDM